jgi:hypothetical protein
VGSIEQRAEKFAEDHHVSVKTQSEAVFEQYLESQNLQWARIPESNQRQPDYKTAHGPTTCIFEVKEFDDPETKPSDAFSPCPPIKRKIQDARPQFKHYKNNCCALVLWNYPSIIPEIVLSAAFGEKVFENRSALGAKPTIFHFSGRSELRSDCNTRFSAIVVLASYRLNHLWLESWRRLSAKKEKGEGINSFDQIFLLQQVASEGVTGCSYEGTIRAVVLENPYARIAFPPDLFVGPFDQHWHMESGCFQPYFMGSELRRLKSEGVPFIYL